MSEILDRVILTGLTAVVVFTALAQGAVEGWSVAIFEWAVAALVLLWGLKLILSGKVRIVAPVAALPLAALVVYGLIQGHRFTGAGGAQSSLSMDTESTSQATTVVCFLLVALLLAVNVVTTKARLKGLATFLAVYGLAMSVFALIQHFAWNGKFYWMIPTRGHAAFGSFVNRNHFAGYMEMLMPIPVGLLIAGAINAQRILLGFAAMMMGTSILACGSRGGLVALVAEMIFLTVASRPLVKARQQKEARSGKSAQASSAMLRFGAVGLISVSIIAGILWIGADSIIDRVSSSVETQDPESNPGYSREMIWQGTAAMIKANPILGVGLGAYETAYPIYATTDGSVVVAQSHNDYLQIVADCGVVGGALAVAFVCLMAQVTLKSISAHDKLSSGLALGAATGVFGILIHSLFDFNLQLPSNALLFLMLCAILCSIVAAQRNNRGKSRRRRRELIESVDCAALPAATA
ncbi:MAG TPA: O-antigen ligase family protein [Blastocatellia bacterium]